MTSPEFPVFEEFAKQGNVVPVWKSLTADLETPVSAYLKIARNRKFSFLLESVEGGERIGRYTYLGADPFLRISIRGDQIEIVEGERIAHKSGRIFDSLRELAGRYRSVHPQGLPPFIAGAVGYLGFDVVREVEPRVPPFREDDVDTPDAVFLFFTSMIVFDHVRHEILAVANVRTDEVDDLRAGYDAAVAEIDEIERLLSRPAKLPPSSEAEGPVEAVSNVGMPYFYGAVDKGKEYILAGDVFQVVLSHRLTLEPAVHPFQIYRALRAVNPSPYLFYLDLDDQQIVGSSPEILVKVEGREVWYRPIAGTRPRGKDEAEDKALAEDLLSDEKEIAEHVMLVDLGRNDVGRVCEFGSVRVPEFKVIENYSHVMHIVSGIRGRLREDKDAFDALQACFPAGTVTGAPKVRAMEIITELEPNSRGLYSGSVLYLDFSGNLNSCIAIRMMTVHGEKAYVQCGAGIVADSVPEKEWQESLNKANALIKAVEKARTL